MANIRQIWNAGAAASVIGHGAALALVLLFTSVRPFDRDSAQAITVDLVAPDEAPPKPEQNQTPEPSAPLLPDVTAKPPAPEQPTPEQRSQPSQDAQHVAAQPPAAASAPSAASPAQPAPSGQAAAPAAQSPPAQSVPPLTPPEPDLTVKYGVTLGLPESNGSSDFDSAAFKAAKLSAADIAAFRRHLKTCSVMPDALAPTDDVWIKLRAMFARDGRLAAAPVLIEGKASPKALALANGAIAALQACQPYAMLPADKYDEWKVLDLDFAPRDFHRG